MPRLAASEIHPDFLGVHTVYVVEGPDAIYVGFTRHSPEARWAGHLSAARRGSNLALHRAIRDHGAARFSVSAFAQIDGYFGARELESDVIAQFRAECQRLYNADPEEYLQRARRTRLRRESKRRPRVLRRELGERLALARRCAGFSVARVAKAFGVAAETVRGWESGAADVGCIRVGELADFYSADPGHLAFGARHAQKAVA